MPHFEKAGSEFYQAACLTNIGGLYRTHNNDSALHYLQLAIGFSKEHGLIYNYFEALDKLCGLYYVTNEFEKAKDVAVQIYRENQGVYDRTQYLSFAIRSFAKLGMTDSAGYYLKLLPPPQTQADTIAWLNVNAEAYRAKGDYRNYSTFALKSDSLAEVMILNSCQAQLKDAEGKYNNTVLKLKSAEKQNLIYILLVVLFALFAVVLFLSLLYQRMKKRHLTSLAEVGAISARLLQAEKLVRDNSATAHKVVDAHFAVVRELNEKLKYDTTSISFFDLLHGKRVNCNLSLDKLSNDFWINLRTATDVENAGIISHIENMAVCNQEDLRLIMLCYFGLSNEVIRLCMDYTNKRTVSNYKNRVIKLISSTDTTLDAFKTRYMSMIIR